MPSVIRIFTKLLCPELEAWDRDVAHCDDVLDTAAPGANARHAAGLRQLRGEAATLLGEHAVQMLWDIEGFFDYLDLPYTADRALELGMRPDALAIFVQLHMAPRLLSSTGAWRSPWLA